MTSFLVLVRVGPIQGNRSESAVLAVFPRISKTSRGRTFSHTVSHRVVPVTSVVSGPPPRSDVRCPRPPDGAFVWSVKRAIVQQIRQMRLTCPRFRK
ncbi:MAG: hypothetical protein BWX50_01110 [Euryarchaeota archaeon ADurb.Bin009]|nr:MAG: hypothetical protein BWX50_01110 [Euryarchaeota archaeon ADurb.Bin009]